MYDFFGNQMMEIFKSFQTKINLPKIELSEEKDYQISLKNIRIFA